MTNKNNKLFLFLNKNKILLIILFLVFLFSIIYSFHFKIVPAVDARAYDRIGLNLAEGNGYREKMEGLLELDNAIERVGPMYEYFLGSIYYVFGHHYETVWIAQAVLRTMSALLIYLITIKIFQDKQSKKKIALVATGIFGFYPDLIEISAMLMTETFYLFLFCLGLFLFFKYFNKLNIYSAVMLGLIFGLATLARPPVLFLIPIIFYYYWQKKNLKYLAVFIITIIIVFIPWTARNYSVYNKIIPFSAAGGYNFWIGNYHGANGEQESPPEARAYAREYGMAEISKESIKQFKNFVITHPLEFSKLTLLRINKYFSIIRPMGFWFYQSGIGQAIMLLSSAIVSVILFVFGLAGVIKSWDQKNEKLKYLVAFTIITPLIIFITVVETRYRFQIYPLLSILAGYFIVYLWQKEKRWVNKILWIAVAVIFINGLADLILSFDRFRERLGWFI